MTIKAPQQLKEFVFEQVRKRHPHTPRYQSYNSAKHILILFESEEFERNVQVKSLIKQLQADGKDVTAWGFINNPQVESSILRDYRILGTGDFNFWGLPLDFQRQDIAREHYDLLIDLNINDLLPLKYLSLYANVDFRAGKLTEEPYRNDFMVDIQRETNPAFLFDQIISYLQKVEVAK